MNRLKFSVFLILLSILVSSCQVFPYAYETTVAADTETTDVAATPQPTQTQVPATATSETVETEEATATPEEPTPEPTLETTEQYIVQEGTPTYLSNFANPDEGCDWMGVAGQVFDEEGNEVLDLVIVVGSTLEEIAGELSSQTGTALSYGPGGYEIKLTDTSLDTSETFWIEVRNTYGSTLSERIYFDTFADCEKNLILINFVQETEGAKGISTLEATPTLEAYP